MQYPVQTKRREVLEYVYTKLQERQARGVAAISLKRKKDKVILQYVKPKEVVNEQLGLNAGQLFSLITELCAEGYLRCRTSPSFDSHSIFHLTDAGLREIGELPDPHAELMQRLDLAILQIQQDYRLSETQKQQTINWLEEGKIVARTLTIDALKAILAGAIL